MCAEEDIARQLFQNSEAVTIVRCDLGILRVVHQLVTGIDVGAANDDDMKSAAKFGLIEGPGCGALGVAGGEARRERNSAERNGVAVMQDAVDMRGREVHGFVVGVMEVGCAAGLDD